MARPLRINIPHGVQHVMSRGNARQAIFLSDGDRRMWLQMLDRVLRECRWLCLAYCLMGNHYHLLIRTPEPNLSEGMQLLNGRYGRWFNDRYERVGHVLQGRFRSKLVTMDSHLLELLRYIPLNPVRQGLCKRPEDWPWSGYAEALALTDQQRLALPELLALFDAEVARARQAYEKFVLDGIGDPVGDEVDVDPWPGRWPAPPTQRPSLEALLSRADQETALVIAHDVHGYRMRELAERLGCHESTVSRRIKAHRKVLQERKIVADPDVALGRRRRSG